MGLTECQFLQGAIRRLGEEDEDEDNLEREPADVDEEPLPRNAVEPDGVDVRREEAGAAAEELEEGDTARAEVEGVELDEVGCSRLVSTNFSRLSR